MSSEVEPAEQILTNGVVYTADPRRPWATTLAVADGRIAAVGDAKQVEAHRSPQTEMRDLDGRFVMPGLTDVHNHHALAGQAELFELRLSPGGSLDGALGEIGRYAEVQPAGTWIVGGNWGADLMPQLSGPEPLRALDAITPVHPVVLVDDSHHNRWANSRALELAGITAHRADPVGGTIVRDTTGEPTGLLIEAAGLIVERAARADRAMTGEMHQRASRRAVQVLNSFGVTAFQDAATSADVLEALHALDGRGELTAWAVTSMLINDQIFGFHPTGEPLLDVAQQYRSAHHRPDFVKIFLDGVPNAHTSALLEPYLPDDQHGAAFRGAPTMSSGQLTTWLRRVASRRLSAKIHCTGDASVRMALDCIEAIRRAGYTDVAMQVAHAPFVARADLPRFAALDVSVDISPFIWFPGVIPDSIATVLPATRARRMHPNRSLLDAGALVAAGSDWPVSETPNPWYGIQGLVTRRHPDGAHPGSLWPEQAIPLADAIAVFTINGARAMGLAEVTGSLSAGKSADYVVLDRNPFELPADELARTRVLETVFAGDHVFVR